MSPKFLLPNRCKPIGWLITIPSFILIILFLHYEFTFKFLDYAVKGPDKISLDNKFLFNIQVHNFTGEVEGLLLIIGLIMVAFSKEPQEDERISTLRLESLLWAVYINSAFLIFSIIFFYNELFLQVMAYNICTPLILFIIRFNWVMYRERKSLKTANL